MNDAERGVDVEIYSHGEDKTEHIRCNYTKLYTGFILLAWSGDPVKLKERIIATATVKMIVLKSLARRSSGLHKNYIATVWTIGEDKPVTYMCDSAKIHEGFLVITSTTDAPNDKLYSTQIVIPAHEIFTVEIESSWK